MESKNIYLSSVVERIDKKRLFFIILGLAMFCAVYCSPSWNDAVDPQGKHFVLTREGKAAIALFLLARAAPPRYPDPAFGTRSGRLTVPELGGRRVR